MTNYNDGMKMPLGKRKLRELIEDAWYDAPSASAGFGRIEVIIEQQIEAERKNHELQAKKNGFYMAAGLFGADVSRVEELWDKCKRELEKLYQSDHSIGSHSDDRGGSADFPCYCQVKKRIEAYIKQHELSRKQEWAESLEKNLDQMIILG